MSELLVRPERFRDRIENFGYEYLSFEARKLAAGGQYAAETGVNELAIVVLGGVCSVATPPESWPRIGGRSNVFDGLPYTLYLPVATAILDHRRHRLRPGLLLLPRRRASSGAPGDAG